VIPMGFCQCGCGERTKIAKYNDAYHGYVRGKPLRFLRHHCSRGDSPFYKIDENGCWIWQRSFIGKTGYGQISRNDTPMGAHKFFYEEKHGPVPKGMTLDHLCRVRACCNPDHLEPVTRGENVRRGHPFWNRGKLTIQKADEIRAMFPPTLTRKERGALTIEVGKKYGISSTHVYGIIAGKVWTAQSFRAPKGNAQVSSGIEEHP
jgi:hypothetical protein